QSSSTPNDDPFFAGQFVGDYSGIAVRDGKPYPIWTAVVPGALFPQMQAMTFAGGGDAVAPGAPALAAPTAGNSLVHLPWTPPAAPRSRATGSTVARRRAPRRRSPPSARQRRGTTRPSARGRFTTTASPRSTIPARAPCRTRSR